MTIRIKQGEISGKKQIEIRREGSHPRDQAPFFSLTALPKNSSVQKLPKANPENVFPFSLSRCCTLPNLHSRTSPSTPVTETQLTQKGELPNQPQNQQK
ncbi:hypothetical protein SLEP1_g4675 [Rubroshorea leprosula]|uniref:Uncharacterized protein n=1 Tax=Rubroshorea leprosula TaxID=152421 RepID=A0AAV5HTS6_9ROSI|nr:hypothetical protein SLEP1_g4675 [Rubroshorea leprosula]